MATTNLELIITAVSVTGTILVAVFAAFGFLHREMRRGFASVDKKFEHLDEKLEEITDLRVAVARIEGHLGIGFRQPQEQRASDGPPERAA